MKCAFRWHFYFSTHLGHIFKDPLFRNDLFLFSFLLLTSHSHHLDPSSSVWRRRKTFQPKPISQSTGSTHARILSTQGKSGKILESGFKFLPNSKRDDRQNWTKVQNLEKRAVNTILFRRFPFKVGIKFTRSFSTFCWDWGVTLADFIVTSEVIPHS